ncbi:hypothetical protein MKK88_20565 [Methylobacterium sp. E-005]|uniref:hypothetical protein n=1 Tax=Methylobacterium sp. E-005 TaxID=2836549 RepID=UPI001FB9A336|nr:hypothetical protein [Methylobacterium sp. E-005]MCJ2088360.1 hypothetical protein [Methylobacterium sp. E-005]
MKPLTPRQIAVLATIREAGVCRIAVRKTQRQPGSHGRRRMVRPQLSDEPTAYRAECGGRRLPIRTVEALLCRGELVPLRRGWSLCVRLKARDPDPATGRAFGERVSAGEGI